MLEIKLYRRGRTHLPIYEVVVAEKRKKNGGSFVEKVGVYDPLRPENSFLLDKVIEKWLSVGAQMTTKVHDIISKAGIFKKIYDKKEQTTQANVKKKQKQEKSTATKTKK